MSDTKKNTETPKEPKGVPVTPPPPKTEDLEKNPFRSKKFIFAMVAQVSWTGIILAILIGGDVDLARTVLGSIAILSATGVQMLYIGGQAALDRYVRLAHIQASSLSNLVPGGDDETESDFSEDEVV